MDLNILWYVLAIAMILLGILGVVLPGLPGLPLTFLGMLLVAWLDDFQRVGVSSLILLGILMALSVLVDVLSTMYGAKRVGASRWGIWGAVIGTCVGLFFMPIGILAGPFLGALIGELWHRHDDWRRATKIGFGTWLGLILGMVLKLALAFAMLGIFVFAWLF